MASQCHQGGLNGPGERRGDDLSRLGPLRQPTIAAFLFFPPSRSSSLPFPRLPASLLREQGSPTVPERLGLPCSLPCEWMIVPNERGKTPLFLQKDTEARGSAHGAKREREQGSHHGGIPRRFAMTDEENRPRLTCCPSKRVQKGGRGDDLHRREDGVRRGAHRMPGSLPSPPGTDSYGPPIESCRERARHPSKT